MSIFMQFCYVLYNLCCTLTSQIGGSKVTGGRMDVDRHECLLLAKLNKNEHGLLSVYI
jgi:hypothetical protein